MPESWVSGLFHWSGVGSLTPSCSSYPMSQPDPLLRTRIGRSLFLEETRLLSIPSTDPPVPPLPSPSSPVRPPSLTLLNHYSASVQQLLLHLLSEQSFAVWPVLAFQLPLHLPELPCVWELFLYPVPTQVPLPPQWQLQLISRVRVCIFLLEGNDATFSLNFQCLLNE